MSDIENSGEDDDDSSRSDKSEDDLDDSSRSDKSVDDVDDSSDTDSSVDEISEDEDNLRWNSLIKSNIMNAPEEWDIYAADTYGLDRQERPFFLK